MPNLTLAIPEELQKIVKEHNEVNWSEIARRAMWEHAARVRLIERIAAKSKLKEEDIDKIDHIIKKNLRKRYSR